ncbi:hypothetical protein RDI58_009728 [Solanum bulbocastanum]|uniref:Uncharacterized protein n=1 Tax=Solanum bulbocastanum TaxID=147425 RepID=A0AAN8YFN1_SOLBU
MNQSAILNKKGFESKQSSKSIEEFGF